MATTYSTPAANCPAIQGPGTARYIKGGSSPDAAYGGLTVSNGNPLDQDVWNGNSLGLDYAHRVGSPGYGIIEGLSCTDSGLTLTVAAGKAHIDGDVELSVATNCTLVNGTNRIWLKRNGTLEVTPTNTPPVLPACFLGFVIAASGVVTSYDLSGVFTHKSLPTRTTGDQGMPLDTPGVSWAFLNVTAYTTWLWDGSRYIELSQAKTAVVPLHAVDTGGGLFSWQNPEAGAIMIQEVYVDVETPATGACMVDIGTTPTSGTTSSNNLLNALDIHTAGLFNNTEEKGVLGKSKQRLAAGAWVTGSKFSGTTAGVAGNAYIRYYPLI